MFINARMRCVILKTFALIFLFFAFLFFELEIIQNITSGAMGLLSSEVGPEMIKDAYSLMLKILMFLVAGYFVYLTYTMMDSAIGVWVYKDDVRKDFDNVIERSVDWAFYKALRVLQVPFVFLSVVLLFVFMLMNFFNLICAFGGVFISVCSFFFSLIMMMLGISFVVCMCMLVFNSMFLFWGDDLVIVGSNEENSDIFDLSKRFFFMKKANLALSVFTFVYLIGALVLILGFEADKSLVLGCSIPLFFILKYIKSWLLEMSFSQASHTLIDIS